MVCRIGVGLLYMYVSVNIRVQYSSGVFDSVSLSLHCLVADIVVALSKAPPVVGKSHAMQHDNDVQAAKNQQRQSLPREAPQKSKRRGAHLLFLSTGEKFGHAAPHKIPDDRI